MKITYESHKLMSFFVENNCLIPVKQTKSTDTFFSYFFKELISAVDYINEQKRIFKQRKQALSRFPNLKHLVLMDFLIKHAKLLMNIQ
jgi:hypothetical protein